MKARAVDVLCVGFACIDINFTAQVHPASDEKVEADSMTSCGGGPASNAAITIARLGGKARFHGHIGNDGFGRAHIRELQAAGVLIDSLKPGAAPTATAAITIKPDGQRSIVCYRDPNAFSLENSVSLELFPAKVLLLDGHQPMLSMELVKEARDLGIPSVLDAGSINVGTCALYDKVDYLVASTKFAEHVTGFEAPLQALAALRGCGSFVAIMNGSQGIYWQEEDSSEQYHIEAYEVKPMDTGGSGDAFHGAFTLGIAQKLTVENNIRRASACGALTCLKIGARNGIPTKRQVEEFLRAVR